MSTTNTQRELIDFLWDWTQPLGSWSKLLVEKITSKQASLDDSERQEVFAYYLQDIGFEYKPPLASLTLVKPSFTVSSKEVILTKLYEVKGVNRLANDQIMEFSPNLTVVYGNNGVGKTGYSRVLKSQGYSFDNNIEILSNVDNAQIGQSAKIEYSSGGSPHILEWEGGRLESDLNAISVFNSDCVNISLSNNRQLLVAPKGFYLFKLVTDELLAMNNMHSNYYTLYPINLHWNEQLNEGTEQKEFIDGLAYNSDLSKLEELSLFTAQHQADLQKKENDLINLSKTSLEARLNSTNLILSELATTITTVKHSQSNLTKVDWKNIILYNNKLKELKAKTQLGIAELAQKYGLERFNSNEFANFLKSADDYIKLLAKENYPNNKEDTCVYCKQDLQNENARKLIDSYSKILNDNTQSNILKYSKLKENIIDRVNLVDDNIIFHQPTFGIIENGGIKQPKSIIDFNAKIKSFKDAIVNDVANENIEFQVSYTIILELLEAKQTEYTSERGTIIQALGNLGAAEVKLKAEIAELKDRKLLSEHKQEVITSITNHSAHKLLEDNKSQFNTKALSIKTTQAREELVAHNFQQKFTAELTGFRKQHLGVNLDFYSQQGTSRIRQQVSNFEINKVLSEGEQKTIALCEFLTELQLDTTIAPVVFDDPVNSLDHLIINDVARRIVELSKERQVIIFTHNVIFYNAFFGLQAHALNRNAITFKFYKVETNGINTGILSNGAPINKLSTYKSKVNVICNSGLGNKSESEVAAEGYAYLRTGLELFVSNTVFKEIVGRYRSNIMMTKFPTVKGDMIDKHKAEIDSLFGRASGFINAHSHPEQQHAPPTMNDLKADFERFKLIEADF